MYEIEYHNINSKSQNLSSTAKIIIDNIKSNNSYYQIFKKHDHKAITESLEEVAKKIRNFSDLVVISMGGATLNPAMLFKFLGQKSPTKIHFLNNTDPHFFASLMDVINIKSTAILAISNSGQTLETNALVGCMLFEYQKNNITDIGARSFFITNSKSGTLKDIASKIGGHLIPHSEGISGRYSGLSAVSLLVGLVAGIDIEAYIFGANSVIDDFCNNLDESKPVVSANSIHNSGKNILVNIGYLQKFEVFLEWYSQIIAESLGKEGIGYTPLRGLGPNDQHSMLQLYLDGERDKLFSLFYARTFDNKLLDYKTSDLNSLGYLANKNLSDINKANFTATINALNDKEMPIRVIMLENVDAMSFGAITCHFMFEIVFIGHLMKLNPFDQPAVELIKKYSSRLIQ